jgi:putative ABC transport system substrate-binding protein
MAISRRRVIGSLAGLGAAAAGVTLLSGCGLLHSQTPHVPRVGFVNPRPLDTRTETQIGAFRAGLQDYGYTDGRNIQIEWRFSASQSGDDVQAIIAELIALPVDLIATIGTPPTQIAKQATSTISILGVNVGDPVGTGLVESLARPGGNVTAVSSFNPALSGKRVELLRQIAPGLAHIGYVYNLSNTANAVNLDELRQAAGTLGVAVRPIALRTLDDLEPGIEGAAREGTAALIVANTGSIPPGDVYTRSAALALRHGLPSMGFDRGLPDAGGLMSDGAEVLAIFRRAGYYVDRILKGSRPADLPVEQPTVFEFVVNLKTAQALGLTIPPEVAAQVTDWVQ